MKSGARRASRVRLVLRTWSWALGTPVGSHCQNPSSCVLIMYVYFRMLHFTRRTLKKEIQSNSPTLPGSSCPGETSLGERGRAVVEAAADSTRAHFLRCRPIRPVPGPELRAGESRRRCPRLRGRLSHAHMKRSPISHRLLTQRQNE